MKKVVLFGNQSVAYVTCLLLTHDSPYRVAGFTVDEAYLTEDTLLDMPVVPFSDVESVFSPEDHSMMIAIGYAKVNQLRAERYYQAKEMGYEFISHISSKALVPPGLDIGENCMIHAGSMIGPFVEIGNNITVGGGSFIGHHTVIKDHCFIGDRVAIAGSVTIEPYCFVGVGATVRNKVLLARETVVGAGALILEDTKEKEVYMGRAADLLPISSDRLSIR